MKTVWKNSTRAKHSKVSAFFLPLPVYLPFTALHSLLFARLQRLKKALMFSEIKVELNLRPKRPKGSLKFSLGSSLAMTITIRPLVV